MNKELEELKEYLEHEVKVYENNKEINQLIGGKLGEKQHKINKILLNYIDNSISKEELKKQIISKMKNLWVDTCAEDSGKYTAYRDILNLLEEK